MKRGTFAFVIVTGILGMIVIGLVFLSAVADANRNNQYMAVATVARGEDLIALAIAYATVCLVLIQIALAWWQINLSNRQILTSSHANELTDRVIATEKIAVDLAESHAAILARIAGAAHPRAKLLAFLNAPEATNARRRRPLTVSVRNDGDRIANGFVVRLYAAENRRSNLRTGRRWTCLRRQDNHICEQQVDVRVFPGCAVILPDVHIDLDPSDSSSGIGWSLHYEDGKTSPKSAEFTPLAYDGTAGPESPP